MGHDSETELLGEQLSEQLVAELRQLPALPYLFIGSGISRRYLGLPDWEGLLRIFAAEIDEDFDYLYASANGDFPAIASALAQAFSPIWWKDARYEAQRAQYRDIVKEVDSALKVAVAEYLKANEKLAPNSPGLADALLREELEHLKAAVVDGVITTNYDSLTDEVFPEFPAYVGQDELLLSDAQFVAETYKIHGSSSQPLSLLLTAKDYENYSRRNQYLAAKLLTIFVEHPVIFIGYSLKDTYIQEILENIVIAVGPDRVEELGQRIYFLEWNEDPESTPTIEDSSLVLPIEGRLPIRRISSHHLLPVTSALTQLERPFPVRVIRELKKHIFDLVHHPDPDQEREVVRAIPIDAEGPEGLRVIFGVGRFSEKDLQDIDSITARRLTREDLARDVLGIRPRGLDAENVLLFGIPDGIRAARNSYIPVFKYLRESNRIPADGKVNFKGLPPLIQTLAGNEPLPAPGAVARFRRDVQGVLTTPGQVNDSDYKNYFKFDSLLCLDSADYELEELREVLASYLEPGALPQRDEASFYRAVSHYDRLKFKNG